MTAMLPTGFEDLEPFVASWSIEGSAARAARRDATTAEERQAFFDAVKGRAGAALDFLDRKPLAQLNAAEERLMNLMLSFAHMVQSVETQGSDEPRHSRFRPEMRLTRTPADEPAATA